MRTAAVLTLLFLGFSSFVADAEDPATAVPATSKAILITGIQRSAPVDFEREILPLMRTSCLACHNRTKAKADLILETPADMLKGGESGPAVIPKRGAESLLLKLAAHQEKPIMPPKDNKVEAANLAPEQLGLLKLWIDQGATGEVRQDQTIAWEALPSGVNPILAVAMTRDGQTIACGRANQLSLYDLPTQRLIGRLTDPDLQKAGLYAKPGIAHRDMVNSLAFSPDGLWLASGDYRAVKLWHRESEEARRELTSTELPSTTSLATSSHGQWIATGHSDGRVALWNSEALTMTAQWPAQGHAIVQLGFSPDGTKLASLSGSSRIGLWSVPAGKSLGWIQAGTLLTALTWTSDGQSVVAVGEDKVIRAWSPPGLEQTNSVQIHELKSSESTVTALASSPGLTNQVVSGGQDGLIRFWNLEKGEILRKLEQGSPVTALALSADGKRLLSTGSNSVARLWNLEDGKVISELKGDFLADAAVLAVDRDLSFSKSEITFRQGALEESRKREKAEADFVSKALENRLTAERNYSEKQKGVLAALEARVIAEKLPAELAAELQKNRETLEAAEGAARQAEKEAAEAKERATQVRTNSEIASKAARDLAKALESDGGKTPGLAESKAAAESLATAATKLIEDARIVAERFAADAVPKRKSAEETRAQTTKKTTEIAEKQKAAPDKIVAAVKALETAEKESETLLVAKRSSEDQLQANQRAAKNAAALVPVAVAALQSAEAEQKRLATDLQTSKTKAEEAAKPILTAAFSRDGSLVFTAGADGKVHAWGADTGVASSVFSAGSGAVRFVGVSGENSVVALESNHAPVVWTRHERWSLARTLGDSPMLQGRVNALQFSPDGKLLAVGSGDPSRSGDLNLWDAASGKLVRNFTNAHSDVVLAVDFSADGKLLASSASDRFVKVWELATGKMSRSFEGHTHHVMGVSWKRDARTLASAGADKVIKVWNYVTGEQKRTIGGAEKELTSIGYVQATGEALVTSGDSQVRLVNDEGKTTRTFGVASDFVQTAAVTADGRWVVGGGQDSVLRIWNGANGQLVRAFEP